MTIYRGKQGIERFKRDIRTKQKRMMSLGIINVANVLVDNSPVGEEFYPSKQGVIQNDAGDYKNSWSVGLGAVDMTTRSADVTGSGSLVDAAVKARAYNFESNVYITNSTEQALNVEYGWQGSNLLGWKPKQGYGVAFLNEDNVRVALQLAYVQASRLP